MFGATYKLTCSAVHSYLLHINCTPNTCFGDNVQSTVCPFFLGYKPYVYYTSISRGKEDFALFFCMFISIRVCLLFNFLWCGNQIARINVSDVCFWKAISTFLFVLHAVHMPCLVLGTKISKTFLKIPVWSPRSQLEMVHLPVIGSLAGSVSRLLHSPFWQPCGPPLHLLLLATANKHVMWTWYARFGIHVNVGRMCGVKKR